MLPSEYCADCGAKLEEYEQLHYLDVCRDCYEEWAAYLRSWLHRRRLYDDRRPTHPNTA